jgi:hypothetical protein
MRGMSLSRIALSAAALALAVLAVLAVLDRLGENAAAAARQALLMRATELERSALQPGSMLPCVDGTAGETVGNACEARVFATPQSTAAAVAYMGARVDLLEDARALIGRGDKRLKAALAGTRRVVALDRYGIAAHVLSRRDGCTPKACDVFAMLDHTDALKANLKAQTFDQYVARYAGRWDASPAKAGPAVSARPSGAPVASAGDATAPSAPAAGDARAEAAPPTASVVRKPEAAHKPVSARWHFPSADSIPAISIMTPEPKLPRPTAQALHRDTARKEAIERRKEGKDPAAGLSTQDSHNDAAHKQSKRKESKARKQSKAKKEAEKKQQEPGAPLQLTR